MATARLTIRKDYVAPERSLWRLWIEAGSLRVRTHATARTPGRLKEFLDPLELTWTEPTDGDPSVRWIAQISEQTSRE